MTAIPGHNSANEPVDYEQLVGAFNQALLHTLRKHSIADAFLDYWVPDADPLLGIVGMVDSARIAGRTEITIRFTRQTIPDERLPDLEQAVARFARASIERKGDQRLLHAVGMSKRDGDTALAARGAKPRYWTADAADTPAAPLVPPAGAWDDRDLPEFADAHPGFRAGLKAALVQPQRERDPGPVTHGLVRATGSEGDTCLYLDIDPVSHIVRKAHHRGARKPSERAVLDLFCLKAEGLPLQEVSDHVGLEVVDSLVDDDKSPPVKGVLLPANAGEPFRLAPRLAREAYESYRATAGLGATTNFYSAAPSAEWQMMPAEERHSKIEGGLRGFLQSQGLYPDDMTLLRVEKTRTGHEIRAVIAFSERIAIDNKPTLLRQFEHRLRRDIERQIELIAERARDSSPLRRLS